MKRASRPRCSLTVRILTFSAGVLISAAELFAAQGIVTETSGDTAVIKLEGNAAPSPGDSVDIFFKLAGSDEEISVATGTVQSVDGSAIKIRIDQATGEVARDQQARFRPGNGKEPAPGASPLPSEMPLPTPTKTLPPSIPFSTAPPKNPPIQQQIDPAAVALVTKGIAQYNAGDISGAIASYTEAIRIAPALAVSYLNRANAYLFKPDFRSAIADANKAIELKVEKMDDAYLVRGSAEAGVGHYDAAIADCNRALKINPKYTLAYNNRANDKIRKRDYSGAVTDCNRSIAIDPNLALPYYNRGFAYFNLGNRAAALADWKRAVQMQPAFGAELNPKITQLEGATRKNK